MAASTLTLPHEVPNGDYFFAKGYESLNAFHEEFPILPGYPVRCTEGCGILMSIEPIAEGQRVANIDLGNDKGWTTNMSFVRHATWGTEQSRQKGHRWPEEATLSPDTLELMGEADSPLRESYRRLLTEQAA